jgi:hypothetical protein
LSAAPASSPRWTTSDRSAQTNELDVLRSTLRDALEDSTPTRAKTVLPSMIDEIRVDARDHIEPNFRVPAVRIDCGYMGEPARRANHLLIAGTSEAVAWSS